MVLQPVPNVVVLMSSIVVHDQMQRYLARELLVQGTQEAEEFLMSMALIAR